MPINFFIIIVAQILIYLFVIWKNKGSNLSLRELCISALFGIVIVFLFDTISSSFGLYTYIQDTDVSINHLWNLTYTETVINGALSFGLAVATVKPLIKKVVVFEGNKQRKLLVISLVLLLVSPWLIYKSEAGTLQCMFALGLFVVAFCESLLLLKKRIGPISELLILSNISSSLLLWFSIICIATAYEAVNFFFPFWTWLPQGTHNPLLIESIIIILGYTVLFYPMITFWKLFPGKMDHSRPTVSK